MSTGLGGASFTAKADVTQFMTGMKRAKEEATRSTQVIAHGMRQLNENSTAPLGAVGAKAERAAASLKRINDQLDQKKATKFSLGLLAVGQTVDDLQYGFRSIVNNIPQMVYLFGGSAGLAGGAAIAAVAINQLIQHWDQLGDLMKSRWLNVAASDLEKLRTKAEEAGEAFEKLMKAPSEAQTKQIAAIREAIVEAPHGGAEAIRKGLSQAVVTHPALAPQETEENKKLRADLERERKNIIPGVDIVADARAKQITDQLKAMNKILEDQAADIVKGILGGALQGGEAGEAARGKLALLIKGGAGGFFPPAFIKAFQAATIDRAEADVEKERRERERARARGVAGQMLQGPLGTELMLGGGEAAGPASKKALEGMMAKSKRRFGSVMPQMLEQMMAAGLTEEQARGVLGQMGPKATFERGKKISKDLGVPLGPRGQLEGTVVIEAVKQVFAEAMKNVAAKPGGLEAKIGAQMKGAGALGAPKDVLQEMREQLKDRVRELMLEKGMTEAQAKRAILRQQQLQAFPGSNLPSQFVGLAQFSQMIQTGALNGNSDIAKRSLDELMAIRKALMNPPRQQVAVAK